MTGVNSFLPGYGNSVPETAGLKGRFPKHSRERCADRSYYKVYVLSEGDRSGQLQSIFDYEKMSDPCSSDIPCSTLVAFMNAALVAEKTLNPSGDGMIYLKLLPWQGDRSMSCSDYEKEKDPVKKKKYHGECKLEAYHFDGGNTWSEIKTNKLEKLSGPPAL